MDPGLERPNFEGESAEGKSRAVAVHIVLPAFVDVLSCGDMARRAGSMANIRRGQVVNNADISKHMTRSWGPQNAVEASVRRRMV
jgi:hypothetical protein